MPTDAPSNVAPRDRSEVPGYLDFAVSTTVTDGVAVVQVMGDLDCYTAPRFRAALLALVGDGLRRVIVDVGGSSFIDSTGLGALVGSAKRFRQQGAEMVVRSPSPTTVKLFQITGVAKLFDIV